MKDYIASHGMPLTYQQYLDAMIPFFGKLYYHLVIK